MKEKQRKGIHGTLSGQGITFYGTRNRTLGFQICCKCRLKEKKKKKVEKKKMSRQHERSEKEDGGSEQDRIHYLTF